MADDSSPAVPAGHQRPEGRPGGLGRAHASIEALCSCPSACTPWDSPVVFVLSLPSECPRNQAKICSYNFTGRAVHCVHIRTDRGSTESGSSYRIAVTRLQWLVNTEVNTVAWGRQTGSWVSLFVGGRLCSCHTLGKGIPWNNSKTLEVCKNKSFRKPVPHRNTAL